MSRENIVVKNALAVESSREEQLRGEIGKSVVANHARAMTSTRVGEDFRYWRDGSGRLVENFDWPRARGMPTLAP